MDAASSSNTANTMIESVVDKKTKISFDSVGGRKSEEIVAELVEVSSDEVSSEDLSLEDEEDYDVDSDEEDSDDEDFDEEEEEEDNERALIFEDMLKLKKLAEFFQHPEKPVEVDGFAAGRCYFSRPDAAEEVDDEERADALADAQALKRSATAYLHPEHPVAVDATACARNFFSQPWASEQETFGQAEARARLVDESLQLKGQAVMYRHPEAPIDLEPGTSMARNYFLRASGPEQMDNEEQALILSEMKALKRAAMDYKHPERALEISSTATARNYFTRASAPEQEEEEDADEREIILEEMKELKQAADVFMHPERPVEIDAVATARCYFDHLSAPEDEEDEREAIMQELRALKNLAVQYMHPEKPVEIDAAACGRNYFTRPSASEQLTGDEQVVLEEMKALKKLAVDYRHPEQPLEVDPAAMGRNYFLRASAAEQEDDEYADEREVVLEEMKELKQVAVDYMHPERPVHMEVSGRSYFDRASAPEQDDEERAIILQEMQALKKLAVQYMHPEKPLVVDAAACGRNYFTRASAAEQEDDEYADDRGIILEEMAELKALASDYYHPEKSLVVDASTFGRNYFGRPSALDQEDHVDAEELKMVLKDASLLRQKAMDYMHPECPVAVDPTSFGRNYYGRASAAEQESYAEAEERASILSEAKELKNGADLFLHPEKPLEVDSAAAGRNYFSRPSACDSESDEDEQDLVLEDAKELKKLAAMFMHPEKKLSVDPAAFGRNYYGRASAPVDESVEEANERARVLADMASLKRLATDYAHPELPVAATDATVFGRNYFSRFSAPEPLSEEAEERAQVLAEAKALKKLAVDYLHPEISVKTSDPAAMGRNYFARASAVGASADVTSSGYSNVSHAKAEADEHSHHDDYGHFEMDEEMFYDMRQSIVLPLGGQKGPKVQSSKLSSDEEGELSRSPSSVMLFTGALEDADHPPLPTMG